MVSIVYECAVFDRRIMVNAKAVDTMANLQIQNEFRIRPLCDSRFQ